MAPAPLVTVKNLSMSISGQTLFQGLSFSIERGKLLTIIGANGCGKSSVLRLLQSRGSKQSDELTEDGFLVTGQVSVAGGTLAAYLPQNVRTDDRVEEFTRSLTNESAGLQARLEKRFGLNAEVELGLAVSDGEFQKRAIINLLLGDDDLYLLDEPTNYLDIAGITAFEDHVSELKSRGKGVILVSHDRTLIDNLADETILLSGHGIYRADGGASSVWAVYDCDFESRRSRAKDIEKKIVQLQSDTRQKADWSAVSERRKIGAGSAKAHLGKLSKKMAKRSKVVQRRCEKEAERLKTTKPFIPKKVKLQFPDYEIRKLNVFSLKEVSFDYGGEQDGKSCKAPPDLLKEIGLSANTGEKMCLMGTNGAGKSTILKLIQKQLTPTGGTVYLNESVKLANIPQGLIGYFDKVRLIDNFESVPLEQSVVRQYLGSVLLRGEKVNQSVASLSSGELMRAALVKCILERAEFLLLDEPTSHLDIESIVVAEQLLAEFKGGFLMISHDRSFVTSTAEQLYYVEGGTLRLV